jgi:hypothetical protein
MLACTHPSFDGPMILFQNIVEILHRSMPAILLQSTLGSKHEIPVKNVLRTTS